MTTAEDYASAKDELIDEALAERYPDQSDLIFVINDRAEGIALRGAERKRRGRTGAGLPALSKVEVAKLGRARAYEILKATFEDKCVPDVIVTSESPPTPDERGKPSPETVALPWESRLPAHEPLEETGAPSDVGGEVDVRPVTENEARAVTPAHLRGRARTQALAEVREEAFLERYADASSCQQAVAQRVRENAALDLAPDLLKFGETLKATILNYGTLARHIRDRLEHIGRPADDLLPPEVAEALVHFHGTEALAFLARNFTCPGEALSGPWDGGIQAIRRARRIGLGRSFAGYRDPLAVSRPLGRLPREGVTKSRDWVEWVTCSLGTGGQPAHPSARADSLPLHDFQLLALERMKATLAGPPARGWLSLPTGAGKTRVAVKALSNGFVAGHVRGVVWVAQTHELCEQGVQAWAEAWPALGDSRPLQIVRMWGGRSGPIDPDAPTVIVTTNQTLTRRLRPEVPAFDDLQRANVVVVDESHHSIAPTYTEFLEAFGLTPKRTERHLLGLSATPFRSSPESFETGWLARRYHQNRYDHGLFGDQDPYSFLQQERVLSLVDHRLIAGTTLSLSQEEIKHIEAEKMLPWLPQLVEVRISRDPERNRNITEAILALSPDSRIVVFAMSVEHAELLAEALRKEGRRAGAISGKTDRKSRQEAVELFRNGELRILTNYRVFATGFDAPKVDVVCIARPTFSKVLYQQMIGRGLRGPKNGGTERCLIMNVADNLGRFGNRIAFRDFEYLWER